MAITTERQDGMVAKYIISKGMPESIQITSKRLARFCAKSLVQEVVSGLTKEEEVNLARRGYYDKLRLKARGDLRNAIIAKRLAVQDKTYSAKRVEETWPEYTVAFEVEGLDNNGNP